MSWPCWALCVGGWGGRSRAGEDYPLRGSGISLRGYLGLVSWLIEVPRHPVPPMRCCDSRQEVGVA